jgi:Tfp pilus assembly protein PilO
MPENQENNNVETKNIENIRIPIKTVIAIIVWIVSVLGIYYTMKFKLDEVQEKATKLEMKIEKYNPEILEYKINNIENQLNKVNEKADKIQILLTK